MIDYNQECIDIHDETVLITGCAGFIGGALGLELIKNTSVRVIGIDNMNDYYNVDLKQYRLNKIRKNDQSNRFYFIKADISDKQKVISIFRKYKPDIVVNLAAQAGVRYSIENPDIYVKSNVEGFFNILEACRFSKFKMNAPVRQLLYASSSSVYGNSRKIPYSEDDATDCPVSFYAATKKANEVMAYSYSTLYGIPTTGMRFFTVYGPAGRPDMAYYKFVENIVSNRRIELYNNGQNKRDFTYVDDVISTIIVLLFKTYHSQICPNYRIYNVGSSNPISTVKFVSIIEKALKKYGVINKNNNIMDFADLVPAVDGDVIETYADTVKIKENYDIQLNTSVEEGIENFVKWYIEYNKLLEHR